LAPSYFVVALLRTTITAVPLPGPMIQRGCCVSTDLDRDAACWSARRGVMLILCSWRGATPDNYYYSDLPDRLARGSRTGASTAARDADGRISD